MSEKMSRKDKIVFLAIAVSVALLVLAVLRITSGTPAPKEPAVMSDLSAERYYLLCSIVSSQQVTKKYYSDLRDTLTDSDLRSRIATIVNDIDEDLDIVIEGYNSNIKVYDPSEAQRHNLQYQLSHESINSCTYG